MHGRYFLHLHGGNLHRQSEQYLYTFRPRVAHFSDFGFTVSLPASTFGIFHQHNPTPRALQGSVSAASARQFGRSCTFGTTLIRAGLSLGVPLRTTVSAQTWRAGRNLRTYSRRQDTAEGAPPKTAVGVLTWRTGRSLRTCTQGHRRGGAAEDHRKCADLAHGPQSAHLQQTPRHRRGGAAEDRCNCAETWRTGCSLRTYSRRQGTAEGARSVKPTLFASRFVLISRRPCENPPSFVWGPPLTYSQTIFDLGFRKQKE